MLRAKIVLNNDPPPRIYFQTALRKRRKITEDPSPPLFKRKLLQAHAPIVKYLNQDHPSEKTEKLLFLIILTQLLHFSSTAKF